MFKPLCRQIFFDIPHMTIVIGDPATFCNNQKKKATYRKIVRKSTTLLLVAASFYVVYCDPPAFFLQKKASKSLDLQSSAQQGSKLHALFTTRMSLYWKLEHKEHSS